MEVKKKRKTSFVWFCCEKGLHGTFSFFFTTWLGAGSLPGSLKKRQASFVWFWCEKGLHSSFSKLILWQGAHMKIKKNKREASFVWFWMKMVCQKLFRCFSKLGLGQSPQGTYMEVKIKNFQTKNNKKGLLLVLARFCR